LPCGTQATCSHVGFYTREGVHLYKECNTYICVYIYKYIYTYIHNWIFMGPSRALGPRWAHHGLIMRSSRANHGGRSWAHHGPIMGHGPMMGPTWADHWRIMGPSWVHDGTIMGHRPSMAPLWADHGPIMGPSWVHHGPMMGFSWTHRTYIYIYIYRLSCL
jgi:hypothetical protein